MTTSTDFLRSYIDAHRTSPKVATRKAAKHIGLLVSQECSMATAGSIGDAFRLANELSEDTAPGSPYSLSVLSESGGLVTSSSGISIWTQSIERHRLGEFHALFVACRDAARALESNDRLLSWIARQGSIASFDIQQGANMVVICKDPMHSTVPIFVFDDAPTTTRTSSATPTDLALAQIERDLSTEIARKIADMLQTTYVESDKFELDDASITTTTEKIRESARWIKENYSNPISVAKAAECAAMSKRNYQRRFKFEFGMTPLEYLLRTRFEVVRAMLRNTDLPVDKIARRCGMGDGNRLGRLFKERYGMSPTQFRAQQRLEVAERCVAIDD